MTDFGAVILGIVRGLWWLSNELLLRRVGWFVGWWVCKFFTLTHYPTKSFQEYEEIGADDTFRVEIIGIVFLACLLFLLTKKLPKFW